MWHVLTREQIAHPPHHVYLRVTIRMSQLALILTLKPHNVAALWPVKKLAHTRLPGVGFRS